MWFPIPSNLWRFGSEHRPVRRKPVSTRLTLEALEDRTVPSSVTAANVSQLIAAINAANATPEADTITLVAGTTFSLTAVNETVYYPNNPQGAYGLPVIAAAGGNLTILGKGNTIERSSAAGTPAFRLLGVAIGASLTLKDLTLQGGLALGWPDLHASAQGGAIYNLGTLSLVGVTV